MTVCPGCGSVVDDEDEYCPDCKVTLHVERLRPAPLRRRSILFKVLALALGLVLLVLAVGNGSINNQEVVMTVISVRLGEVGSDGTVRVTLHIYLENHRNVSHGGIVPKIDEFELTSDRGGIYSCASTPQNILPGSIFRGEDGYVTLCFDLPSDERPSLLRYQWGAAFSSTASCPPS